MWELGVIFGLSFVPVYLHRWACDIDSPLYKTFVYLFNLFFVGIILRVAQQIAQLNDAGVAKTVGILYTSYLFASVILIAIYFLLLRKEMSGKGGSNK